MRETDRDVPFIVFKCGETGGTGLVLSLGEEAAESYGGLVEVVGLGVDRIQIQCLPAECYRFE